MIKNNTIKYYANKEKGVVVAKAHVGRNDIYNEVYSLAKKSFNCINRNEDEYKITAKATLSTADEFSYEKGKNIARRRLLIKYYKKRIKNIKMYIQAYEDLVARLKASLEHSERSIEKLKKNLENDIK